MESIKKNNRLFRLLGAVFLIQAMTALIGGTIVFGPFDSTVFTGETLVSIANSTVVIYISIFLQLVTAIVIIMLGVAIYFAVGHINKTFATMALCFYILESALLAISQVFVFALSETSHLYIEGGDASLVLLGHILLSSREFTGKMAMIPFGIGALLFYFLLMKSKILPKWLALWGILTVSFILIGAPLMAFGIAIPFILLIPYVPFEFFTGIFILVKYRRYI